MLSKVNRVLATDARGALNSFLDRSSLIWVQKVSTFLMRLEMKRRGITYGKHVSFWGRTYFRRKYRSSIVIGNNCRFRSHLLSNYIGLNRPCLVATMARGAEVSIGDGTGLSGTVICAASSIRIGKNVLCGGNTLITDFDWHEVTGVRNEPAPIIIEDRVWLGVNVTILKGVTIGTESVVGANSTVCRSIPPRCIAAGNPCKVLRKI